MSNNTWKYQDFSFATNYAKYRPDYPALVFEELMRRHKGGIHLAVDVGAGTGQASIPLTQYFDKVIAVDPSQTVDTSQSEKLEFRRSVAEQIDFIPDAAVDLIVSAEAIHWFDLPRFWKECDRLLKSNGTLSFWGYGVPTLENKEAEVLLQHFDRITLGKYWRPNRSHIEDCYVNIKPDQSYFPLGERWGFSHTSTTSLASFIGHLDTWSHLAAYRTANNIDRSSANDPLNVFHQKMLSIFKEGDDSSVTFSYPIFMVFAWKKKEA